MVCSVACDGSWWGWGSYEKDSWRWIQDRTCGGLKGECVSNREPGSPKKARYLARRLRKRMPNLPMLAGFWGVIEDGEIRAVNNALRRIDPRRSRSLPVDDNVLPLIPPIK